MKFCNFSHIYLSWLPYSLKPHRLELQMLFLYYWATGIIYTWHFKEKAQCLLPRLTRLSPSSSAFLARVPAVFLLCASRVILRAPLWCHVPAERASGALEWAQCISSSKYLSVVEMPWFLLSNPHKCTGHSQELDLCDILQLLRGPQAPFFMEGTME